MKEYRKIQILEGDCIESMKSLPDASVHCVVTSPPYWGLRDYGQDGQIGLEETPEAYVARMVEVFREVRRVLRDDGTLWLNLGDSYNGSGGAGGDYSEGGLKDGQPKYPGRRLASLKPKDLVGIPWRVAFALQADGWWLRQDIIWHKPNPMPESVTDRCTKSHEYVFLLTKSATYFYDHRAISEPAQTAGVTGGFTANAALAAGVKPSGNMIAERGKSYVRPETRNKRSVWTITTKPFSGAHFAVMPPDLVEPCVLAGCPEGGTVLDPFGGSGTTALVAEKLGRDAILCELNPEYIEIAWARIRSSEYHGQGNLFTSGGQ
jgi:DNA modification methylase